MKNTNQLLKNNIILITWIAAIIGMFASLYLSEVKEFTPCKLCWYQRIFLFSTVFVLGAAEFFKDTKVYRYILPLTITGGSIALYHSLLQWGILPEGELTCNIDASCATKQIDWFGFVTIPFMSLVLFLIITGLMLLLRRQRAGMS